jgi:diguanylate cyclase (GGDEF)-like protein
MKLNRRVQLLIIPVLFTSFLLVAVSLYLVERNSIFKLNQRSAELEATELAASFSQYTLIARGFLSSLIQSDALRYFLDSTDEHFKSLALSSGLDGVLNSLTDLSSDHFSITFIRGSGELDYYYENSLDPFSTPDPQLQEWASELFASHTSSASKYFLEKERMAYCRILDRLTLKPPLAYGTDESFAVIVMLSPTEFLQRSKDLAKVKHPLTFWPTPQAPLAPGQFEARREIAGFGILGVQIAPETVSASLIGILQRLTLGFLALMSLTYVALHWLLAHYVVRPINLLEQQLSNVDLNATEEIAVHNSQDEIGNLSVTFARLYDKLKDTYEGTRELAERDALTTLYNRRVFNLILQKLLTRADISNSNVGLLYIDIDNFKFVNDQYGHSVGDALLRTFALRLHDVVRGGDIIFEKDGLSSTAARLAGDEFAVIVHGYSENDVPGKVARRILQLCENGFNCEEGHFPISLSVGVATFPDDGQTSDELIVNADSAMYQSKKSGKNAISFYSEGLGEAAKRQQSLEMQLKKLKLDEFELYYMPIVNLETGEIHSFEALLRWHSKSLGSVSPAEFIPLAESLGVFQKIDLWVLERAFAEAVDFRERFGEQMRISINISAAELSQANFVTKLFQLVKAYQVDPSMFTLELTETFYQDNNTLGPPLLSALADAGFHLAIDDLGSGYSSLLQLVEFPISMVKLDKTFIEKSLANANLRILQSLVEFCHVQNLDVTAEGVEDESSIKALSEAGCDYLQGYYFSKPLPLADALKLPFKLS